MGETKCQAGMFARGDGAKDMAKWLAVADAGYILIIFLWGEHSLQICTVNSMDKVLETKSLVDLLTWGIGVQSKFLDFNIYFQSRSCLDLFDGCEQSFNNLYFN